MVVAPGLEQLALDELRTLGVKGRIGIGKGGLDVDLTTRQLYAVHRHARIPTRVLVRVGDGTAHRFDQLQFLARGASWGGYLVAGEPVTFHVASQASTLYHEGAVEERLAATIGHPVAPHGMGIYVRIDRNRVIFSVDATGAPMHHRGWRTGKHASPLRATLAAAMLRAAGYDGSTPLVDPMAGSGTIAIEAAGIALGHAHERPFAFQSWPSFEPGTWASVTAGVTTPSTVATILAADRDAGAVAMVRTHIEAAGLAGAIEVQHAALTDQQWPGQPSLVVVNPPYGQRVGRTGDLRDLYAALGAKVAGGSHRLCLLAPDQRLAKATGLTLEERFATSNGGIPVRCLVSAD